MGFFANVFKANTRNETPEQRKKRLIDEGKATESDYYRPDVPEGKVDPDFAAYAQAKNDEAEKKRKKAAATTKAQRVIDQGE